MDLIAIIALFAGITGLTFGSVAFIGLKKLIAHLKERGVIDEKYPDPGA